MTSYNVPKLSDAILEGVRMGNLPEGTGLDIKRYMRTNSDGTFSSSVVYIEEWNTAKTECRIRGACTGYAGGGEYESSFFLIDATAGIHQVLDFSEAEEDEHSEIFNALLFECGRMYDEDDGEYSPTEYANDLLANGEETEDGVIYHDPKFDGDILDEVSHGWAINLRFES